MSTEDDRSPGSSGGGGTRRRLPAAVGVGFGIAVAVGRVIGAGVLRAPHRVATGVVLLGSLAFLGGSIAAAPRDGAIAVALAVLAYPVCRLTRRRA